MLASSIRLILASGLALSWFSPVHAVPVPVNHPPGHPHHDPSKGSTIVGHDGKREVNVYILYRDSTTPPTAFAKHYGCDDDQVHWIDYWAQITHDALKVAQAKASKSDAPQNDQHFKDFAGSDSAHLTMHLRLERYAEAYTGHKFTLIRQVDDIVRDKTSLLLQCDPHDKGDAVASTIDVIEPGQKVAHPEQAVPGKSTVPLLFGTTITYHPKFFHTLNHPDRTIQAQVERLTGNPRKPFIITGLVTNTHELQHDWTVLREHRNFGHINPDNTPGNPGATQHRECRLLDDDLKRDNPQNTGWFVQAEYCEAIAHHGHPAPLAYKLPTAADKQAIRQRIKPVESN